MQWPDVAIAGCNVEIIVQDLAWLAGRIGSAPLDLMPDGTPRPRLEESGQPGSQLVEIAAGSCHALCGENGPFCGCVGGQHNDTGISTPLGQDEPGEDYYRSFENPDDTP